MDRTEGTAEGWLPDPQTFKGSGWCELRNFDTEKHVAFIEPGDTIPSVGSMLQLRNITGPNALPATTYEVLAHIWHMEYRTKEAQSTFMAAIEAGETTVDANPLRRWLIILVRPTIWTDAKVRLGQSSPP